MKLLLSCLVLESWSSLICCVCCCSCRWSCTRCLLSFKSLKPSSEWMEWCGIFASSSITLNLMTFMNVPWVFSLSQEMLLEFYASAVRWFKFDAVLKRSTRCVFLFSLCTRLFISLWNWILMNLTMKFPSHILIKTDDEVCSPQPISQCSRKIHLTQNFHELFT